VTKHGRFTEIPKLALLKELTNRISNANRVIRSDMPPPAASAPAGFSVIRKNRKAIRLDFEVPVNSDRP
jgi:hypothetical protein